MATPEGKVKNNVKKILKAHGAYQHWPVQTGYGAACLDCHGCHLGRYFAVETKAPGKKLTPRQELTKEEVEAAGGVVFIVGEKIVHRRGDTIRCWNGDGTEGTYTTQTDIYSGEEELEAWLESGYK